MIRQLKRNMEKVKVLLDRITESWNDYFWEFKYCQDRIRFNEDIKTNYYGDILSYFNGTLDSLSNIKFTDNFQESIFQAVAILQLIYSHQDLTDELLYIFKLEESTKEDKNPNRDIRNELVGHPIRRIPKGGALISSVYFGTHFKNGTIHYVLYSRENGFVGKDYFFNLTEIIYNHRTFIEKYALIILRRIKKILGELQKELSLLNRLIDESVGLENLIKLVEQFYDPILKDNYLFDPLILRTCNERRGEHPRYENTVSLFVDTLREYLPERIKSIDEIFVEKIPPTEWVTPQIIFVKAGDNAEISRDRSEHLDYEFSKLMSNHPIYDIQYFKGKFQNDDDILEELINMENNLTNKLEYYSSFEYLEVLLKKRGLLKRGNSI